MASDEPTSRLASELSEEELEEMIRELIQANFRSDIARAATVWLEERIAFYNALRQRFD